MRSHIYCHSRYIDNAMEAETKFFALGLRTSKLLSYDINPGHLAPRVHAVALYAASNDQKETGQCYQHSNT